MRRYEITIPKTTIEKVQYSDFQWSFTVFEDLEDECRAQYSSKEVYKRFIEITVDGIFYDLVIFDFLLGKLILETKEVDKQKVLRILKYFTIHTSRSRAYFINSRKSDGVV